MVTASFYKPSVSSLSVSPPRKTFSQPNLVLGDVLTDKQTRFLTSIERQQLARPQGTRWPVVSAIWSVTPHADSLEGLKVLWKTSFLCLQFNKSVIHREYTTLCVQMNQWPIKTLVRNNLTLTSAFNSQDTFKLNINMNKKHTREHKMPV